MFNISFGLRIEARNGRGVSPASHYIKELEVDDYLDNVRLKTKTAFGTTCLRTPFLL